MQFNTAIGRRPNIVTRTISRSPSAFSRGRISSQQANDEIHAFIAARDMSLVEAERSLSDMSLNRAFLAKDLVTNYLKPACSPYQAQSLPEEDAARERKRCEAAKVRLEQLRARTMDRFFDHAVAA